MRKIKFRVWDKCLKYMHICGENGHDDCFYDENNNFHYYNLQNGDGSGEKGNYILMQYTGLKDKNGKEIYEADIVRIDCPTMKMTGEIKYSEMSAMFYLYDEIEDIEETLWYQEKEYEVLGNIYDNPELLKGEENG